MDRTIRVTGKGQISVAPDTIRLLIKQENVVPDYHDAIEESADRKAQLFEAIKEHGFVREDIKTLHFDIDTEYGNYQTKDKSWRRRFVGYKYSHRMKIEFAADNDRLGRVLGALASIRAQSEFSIVYTVSDPEEAKNKVLAAAVDNIKNVCFD